MVFLVLVFDVSIFKVCIGVCEGVASFYKYHLIDGGVNMLEPSTTTSEVLLMYVGIFVFLFGLAYILMKKNS